MSWRSPEMAWPTWLNNVRNAALPQISAWLPNWVMTSSVMCLTIPSRSPASMVAKTSMSTARRIAGMPASAVAVSWRRMPVQ